MHCCFTACATLWLTVQVVSVEDDEDEDVVMRKKTKKAKKRLIEDE